MKVGDIVKVINPERVIRVGYNESIRSAREKMEDEFYDTHEISMFDFFKKHFSFACDLDHYANKLARDYLDKKLHFGGLERKVFTEYSPEYEGKLATIAHRMVKKSGIRTSDSDGRYLERQQTHVLFNLRFHEDIDTNRDFPAVKHSKWTHINLDLKCMESSYENKFYNSCEGRWYDDVFERCNLEWVSAAP